MVFAAAHPDRVRGLVVYSSYARLTAAAGYEGLPAELVDAFIHSVRRDWGAGSVSRVSFQGAPQTDAAGRMLARWERSLCTPTMAAHILRCNADIDVRSLLPALKVPTLVLQSRGDPISPPALGRYVADHIPGARYVEGEAEYHLPWDGASAWFLPAVEHFVCGAPTQSEPRPSFLSTVLCVRGPVGTDAESEVRRFGGEVVGSTDGMTAILDSPSRAVACALALRAIEPGAALGIHTGEVERADPGVVGAAVEIAREVAGLARAGEVLVSRPVRDLTSGAEHPYDSHGMHLLADALGEHELFVLSTQA